MTDREHIISLELRKLSSAAYMACYYGVSRDDLEAALEEGIADASALLEQKHRTDELLASLRHVA